MLIPRLLTQHTSEAMHVQRNDGQSNRSGKSLSTFRPNTVEATVFKIVDGRLHSGVLTAHGSKGFTLFAIPLSLAEAALLGQDVVNKHFICGKACKDDPLGGKSASSLTHLVWLQKLLFVVQRWKGKRG